MLGALALDDFQLQATIRFGQLQRAQPHALFQIFLGLLAFQCGENVAADKFQQRQILLRVADVLLVALHHQCTAGLTIAQHRHAKPVEAV